MSIKQLCEAERQKRSNDPEYVAWWIAEYKKLTKSTEEDICKMLNISPGALTGLAICKKPAADDEYFLRLDHLKEVNGEKFSALFSYVEVHRGQN